MKNIACNTEELKTLKAGELITLSGTVLTVRDGTLKRIAAEERPPLPLKDRLLFFCGPTPTPKGRVVGALGPTTTDRMTAYFPLLFDLGACGFIGKGTVAPIFLPLFKNRGILLAATGGVGALLSKKALAAKVVAYPDLGAEAIWELTLKDFPAFVTVDFHGSAKFVGG